MRNRKLSIGVAALAVVLVGIVVGLVATGVLGDRESQQAGACDGTSYALEAEEDDGVLEASFELRTQAPGETWQVRLEHGGEVLLDSTRTSDEDAEVDADVYLPRDATGDLSVTATPTDGGPACTASVTVG